MNSSYVSGAQTVGPGDIEMKLPLRILGSLTENKTTFCYESLGWAIARTIHHGNRSHGVVSLTSASVSQFRMIGQMGSSS